MGGRIERLLLCPVLAVMAMGMAMKTHGVEDLLNPLGESEQAFEQRMAWFNEARFGMFIHWGAYSVLGGEWQGKPVKGYAVGRDRQRYEESGTGTEK